MGKMKRFSYPPCSINPVTEKPYSRHKWMIVGNNHTGQVKQEKGIHYYRVRCTRCGLNDPHPPTF